MGDFIVKLQSTISMNQSNLDLTPDEIAFAEQMNALGAKAEQHLSEMEAKSGAATYEDAPGEKPCQADSSKQSDATKLLQFLRPMVEAIKAISNATLENKRMLAGLEIAVGQQAGVREFMIEVDQALQAKTSTNQKLFDTLYEEMKGYRDSFLLEVLHKPIVHDLIFLFDDLSEIHRQAREVVSILDSHQHTRKPEKKLIEKIKVFERNLDHSVCSLVEVMERIEIQAFDVANEKLDKTTQRVVGIEPAASEEEDNKIIRNVRPGFRWRDRIIRPQEVMVKKWENGNRGSSSPQ